MTVPVIWRVFFPDLGWLMLLLCARRLRLTGWAKRLLLAMTIYVVIEMFFHRFMEDAVARLM
jgi:hypothetical protein